MNNITKQKNRSPQLVYRNNFARHLMGVSLYALADDLRAKLGSQGVRVLAERLLDYVNADRKMN